MRCALTISFVAGTLLLGCTLPEGKLAAPATESAGDKAAPKRSDAGSPSARDAAVMSRDSAVGDGDAHDVEQGGKGGAASRVEPASHAADDAEDAGSPPAPSPKPNGDTCTTSKDCASGNCRATPDGRRCYGLIAVDKACSSEYDCDGYACVAATSDGKSRVCVDTSSCGTKDPCAQDYWAATCQLDQLCNAESSSFNQCYRSACMRPRDSSDLCMKELGVVKNLIATRCCPPAGAYHSSCDPAPQCGCKDGEKCDVVSSNGQTSCGPAGSVPELGDCSADSDCMVGFFCTVSGCKPYCDGPDDRVCAPHGACRPVALGGVIVPGISACTRLCDPTSPDEANGPFAACRSGQRCEPAPDGSSDCFAGGGGSGRQGASCNKSGAPDPQACAPGFVCLPNTLTCTQYCKVALDDCAVGTCHSNGGIKMYAFDVEIGYCASP